MEYILKHFIFYPFLLTTTILQSCQTRGLPHPENALLPHLCSSYCLHLERNPCFSSASRLLSILRICVRVPCPRRSFPDFSSSFGTPFSIPHHLEQSSTRILIPLNDDFVCLCPSRDCELLETCIFFIFVSSALNTLTADNNSLINTCYMNILSLRYYILRGQTKRSIGKRLPESSERVYKF